MSERSDEDILQKYASTAGEDLQLNQVETNRGTIKQGRSYWDVTIAYELKNPAFNHTSRAKWTFTSNETGASILSVLEMALSKFDVVRYDFLRYGYEIRFIDLNIKLIEE